MMKMKQQFDLHSHMWLYLYVCSLVFPTAGNHNPWDVKKLIAHFLKHIMTLTIWLSFFTTPLVMLIQYQYKYPKELILL